MNTQPHKAEFEPTSLLWPVDLAREAWAYGVDTLQRSILFLDVLRERAKGYEEHAAKLAPHVLKFECELVMDGRKLPRPVNYLLVRITPPAGVEIDERKRPFVVVDPRHLATAYAFTDRAKSSRRHARIL